jgi:metal-responsive CopG/Arc/MetJ family transcriptional regulator
LKTIQVTIEDALLEQVDELITELETNRSAFIRSALQTALNRHRKKLLEQKHAEGYARVSSDDWGDDW